LRFVGDDAEHNERRARPHDDAAERLHAGHAARFGVQHALRRRAAKSTRQRTVVKSKRTKQRQQQMHAPRDAGTGQKRDKLVKRRFRPSGKRNLEKRSQCILQQRTELRNSAHAKKNRKPASFRINRREKIVSRQTAAVDRKCDARYRRRQCCAFDVRRLRVAERRRRASERKRDRFERQLGV
jgi:type IV secretory pathway VirB10-like protein